MTSPTTGWDASEKTKRPGHWIPGPGRLGLRAVRICLQSLSIKSHLEDTSSWRSPRRPFISPSSGSRDGSARRSAASTPATSSTDDTIAEIRQALLAHRVVFFRDQHLDYERQVAFAQRFGPLTLGHPTCCRRTGSRTSRRSTRPRARRRTSGTPTSRSATGRRRSRSCTAS